MSDPAILGIVGALQAIALAVIAAWLKQGQDRNHTSTQKSLDQVRSQTNGRMDQLLSVTGESERAKGVIEGVAQAKGEAEDHNGPGN